MNIATTMTDAGQVTIPESFRTAAGLAPGVLIEMSASNGGVLIKRAENKRRPLTKEDIEAVAGPADIKWPSTDAFMAFIRGDDD